MTPASEWIEWAGGECPVPANAPVEAKWLNGDTDTRTTKDTAGMFGWRWNRPGHAMAGDIIAYRKAA